MKKEQIAKYIAAAGVALGLLAASPDLLSAKPALIVGIIAAGLTAAGSAFKKYEASIAVTICGAAIAVVGAITPGMMQIDSTWGRRASAAGIVIAALGRGLFNFDPSAPPDESHEPKTPDT